MESQPQNPEFRINLENFHLCKCAMLGPSTYTVNTEQSLYTTMFRIHRNGPSCE